MVEKSVLSAFRTYFHFFYLYDSSQLIVILVCSIQPWSHTKGILVCDQGKNNPGVSPFFSTLSTLSTIGYVENLKFQDSIFC